MDTAKKTITEKTPRPDQRAARVLEDALNAKYGESAVQGFGLHDERHTRDCYTSSWDVDVRLRDRVVATRRALVYLYANGTSEVML